MNIYPKNLPQLLDFEVILDRIEELCFGLKAKANIKKLSPLPTFEITELTLSETNEYFMAFMRGDAVSVTPYPETDKEVQLLGVDNSALGALQFHQVRKSTEILFHLMDFLADKIDVYPYLSKKFQDVPKEKFITESIHEIIDKDGIVKDHASPLLASIRKELMQNRQTSDRIYRNHIQRLKKNNQLADIEESYVNGRRVIGVFAEYKREVKGIILGQSTTGKIAFIEPQNVIDLNNDKLRLEEEEKNEIYRILKVLTDMIRPFQPLLKQYNELLVEIDMLEGKAKLAKELKATRPVLSAHSGATNLINAFHPVLLLSKKEDQEVVPMNCSFHAEQRVMVISGPNAGGKSITLKTIGLLQLMLQCGLLIPVSAKSELYYQQQLFGDIGDSQSIEDGLSTYSSRLQKMKYFLENMNEHTLFLIDEFGTGSDPDMGGAMAEVILHKLADTGAFGVVTTHFTNLKLLANHHQGVFNACMLFNSRNLKPLYQLFVGEPGSSFTFEVAQKIGLPQDLIDEAKQKLSKEKLKMDKLLSELQVQKNSLSRIKRDLQKQMGKTTAEKREFQELNEKLEHTISRTVEHRDERKKLIDYGKKLHQLTQEWVQTKNKKIVIDKFVKLAGYELAKQRELDAYEKTEAFRTERIEALRGKIEVGSRVRVMKSKEVGIVRSLQEDRASVEIGRILMNIGLEKLEPAPLESTSEGQKIK
ncbi:MAG: hypothetical protein JNM95_07815 [Chitinophagaceae bacterium]|nr:hypothetical protein [Chitinophagaceae bacterium]